jgi:hypothetical protein
MDVNNQGLNLPSNLQNLDVRNELLSKEVGSGASCAYSLRDLTGSNKKVARVRRTPHDTTAQTIDDERIFGGQEVQAGYLEDWVNGKLEHTLPADVATAQGSYSLRKIKASYAEDAVRIRRIDNTEVDVAFDLDGKVSTSSSITNVASGDVDNTAETTLGNFLQGEADVRALFNSSAYFSSDSDYFSTNLTLSGAFTISFDVVFTDSFNTNKSRIFQDNLGNDLLTFTASDVCKFRVNGLVRAFPALSTALQLGRKYSMIFARDGSGNYTLTIDGVQVSSVSGTDTDDFLIQRIGFRNRGSISNININSGQHIYAGDGAENSNWTDTGSGTTTNATKVGTPVAFTGQGIDSFVHTWYNQSGDGSNGATQATSTKQPKIATSGTLLDHLLFDGTDDFLADTNVTFEGAVSLACLSEKSANGLYPLSVARQEAINRFFAIQEQASTSVFIARNSSSQSISANTGGDKRLTFARTNSDTSYSVASMGRGLETGTNDYGSAPTASLINHVVIGSRETGSSGTPSVGTWNGKIFEVITYQTDETDDKFKIESNINNYYGLYNDANDLEGTEFTGSTGTYTNNSKDGFTFSGTSTQSFVGIELKESVPVGETVYISFNCTHNNYSETTLVSLRKSSVTGTNASSSYSIPQYGFGVASLTSTDADAKFITFQIRQNSPTVTVSDFKVSRIARNGVVETLYDQSGSGNNATQSSATKQPYVVQNGGQCKMTNGNPAVMGTRYADDKITFLEMDTGISDPYTVFSSMYTTRSFSLLFGGNNVGSTPRILLNTGSIQPLLNATDDFGSTSTDNTIDSVITLFSAENGGTAVLRKNGTQLDSLARTDDEIRPLKFLFRHQNNNSNKGVFFDSFIVYGSDKTSDFTDIEDQLKLENNIS